jgi:transposase-like protein
MNEHVKELVEKAGFELAHVPGGKDSEFYYEDEFAALVKLVVQEAIHYGALAFANDASVVPTFPAQQLRKHFGIEE